MSKSFAALVEQRLLIKHGTNNYMVAQNLDSIEIDKDLFSGQIED